MNIQELYNELSLSEIELEEEEHIYLDKEGYFYNSVTGVLSLIKNDFKTDDVIEGLLRQYNTFFDWYKKNGGSNNELTYYLSLYVNYRQFTEWEYSTYQGETYKRYLLKLTDFVNLFHFKNYYEDLASKNLIQRKKNLYITPDYQIMSKKAIKEMWQDMTDIANHYGNIVHLTLERFLLYHQGIKFTDHQYDAILNHFSWIKNHIGIFYNKYPHSKHSFEEYDIDCSLIQLMKHIEDQFQIHQLNMGRCVVPEKRLLYKKLAGTTDIYVDIDNFNFGLGDHKTNKDFSMEDPYDQKLLMPGNYQQTHYNLYRFQMNIYAFMIEKLYNKKLNFLYITYYSRKTNNFTVYDMEYNPYEADWLIENYISWITAKKEKLLSSSMGNLIESLIKPQWMDHFTKNFMYFIKSNKNSEDKKIYSDYIINYENKFRNYSLKKH